METGELGLHGVFVALPVEKAFKKEPGCVTVRSQIMEEKDVQAVDQKNKAVQHKLVLLVNFFIRLMHDIIP